MSGKTGIEWCDATWNPVRGCSRVSPGCQACYAERQAIRQAGEGGAYEGLVRSTPAGPRWTGQVRLVPELLDQPLRWRRPRAIFVNSMSDLFHEGLRDEEVADVFGVMALAKQHCFLVLTKRAQRMTEWFRMQGDSPAWFVRHKGELRAVPLPAVQWPLPNVWLGVSCENQEWLEKRAPYLMDLARAGWPTLFSLEPALGPMNIGPYLGWTQADYERTGFAWPGNTPLGRVRQVIAGGESGPGARSCRVEWLRSLRDQCAAAGVPFFLKQLGARCGQTNVAGGFDYWGVGQGDIYIKDRKGGDPSEWPEDLRQCRELAWSCHHHAEEAAV